MKRLVWVLLTLVLSGCQQGHGSVVVYTSVDQVHAAPVLEQFQRKTGIAVLPVYDVEASKTTGLVNRIRAERSRPQADLFWNGEFAQTLELQQEGLLANCPEGISGSEETPLEDPKNQWLAVGRRARVFLINDARVGPQDRPRHLEDVFAPGRRVGLALPLFGTSATQAAALYALWGPSRARAFYARVQASSIRIVDGNSVVRDLVEAGQLDYGLTDTDDAWGALQRQTGLSVEYPDQGEAEMGTLVIPGTLAILAGAPHPQAARQLLAYLAGPDAQAQLRASGWSQYPPSGPGSAPIRALPVRLEQILEQMPRARSDLRELFVDR